MTSVPAAITDTTFTAPDAKQGLQALEKDLTWTNRRGIGPEPFSPVVVDDASAELAGAIRCSRRTLKAGRLDIPHPHDGRDPQIRMSDSWQRHPSVVWRAAPGYLVVGRPGSPTMEVYGPGADMWELLPAAPHVTDLCRQLADRFHAELADVRPGIESLLIDLERRGFVDHLR